MAKLEYSIDAKNIINKFYGVERILYVEGEDDIPFWELIFEKFASIAVKVEEVGGKNELAKYADSIYSGEADFIVAMDADYDHLYDSPKNPSILYTYGYSIENTIINEKTLTKVIKNIGRLPRKEVSDDLSDSWLSSMSISLEKLIVYDIVNRQDKLGVQVIPDNSDRFMLSKNTCDFSERKIEDYVKSSGLNIDSLRIKKCQTDVKALGLSPLELLKGHFLMSAVIRFVKVILSRYRSSISVSKEMLFGNLMTAFEILFNSSHPHYKYYERQVSLIKS